MQESERHDDLAAWEARLSAFRPVPGRLDRDQAMYHAGRASVRPAPASRAASTAGWAWPTALGAMTAIAGCLLAVLVARGPNVSPPAVANRVLESTDESDPLSVQAQPVVEESGDHDQALKSEPQRALWPPNSRPENLAARSAPSDLTPDADQKIAQLERDRTLPAMSEPDYQAGPHPRSSEQVQPSRPRSLIEYRRTIFEELAPAADSASKTNDFHPYSGV